MRRVIPPSIQFYYADAPESEEKLTTVYDFIFGKAREKLVQKTNKKELKYSNKSSYLTTKRHQGNVCVAERTL